MTGFEKKSSADLVMEKITEEMEKRISDRFEQLRKNAGWSYRHLGWVAFGHVADQKAKAMNLLQGKTNYSFADFCRLCCAFDIDPGKLFMNTYDNATAAMPESTACKDISTKAQAAKPLKKSNPATA